ncbi:UNVERIFIED_CONTAM: hypothetical protein FKN15_004809 [Acipenser sinensis]
MVVMFQKLLGLMVEASQTLPLGLLHMRPLQACGPSTPQCSTGQCHQKGGHHHGCFTMDS